jgi:hypothetical protein
MRESRVPLLFFSSTLFSETIVYIMNCKIESGVSELSRICGTLWDYSKIYFYYKFHAY